MADLPSIANYPTDETNIPPTPAAGRAAGVGAWCADLVLAYLAGVALAVPMGVTAASVQVGRLSLTVAIVGVMTAVLICRRRRRRQIRQR